MYCKGCAPKFKLLNIHLISVITACKDLFQVLLFLNLINLFKHVNRLEKNLNYYCYIFCTSFFSSNNQNWTITVCFIDAYFFAMFTEPPPYQDIYHRSSQAHPAMNTFIKTICPIQQTDTEKVIPVHCWEELSIIEVSTYIYKTQCQIISESTI